MKERVHASNSKSTARHTWPAACRYNQCFKKTHWHALYVDTFFVIYI